MTRDLIIPADAPDDLVLAAGGIVHRMENEQVEVACIYREQRGDWTFPKGKLDEGESFEDAALREVLEETGLHCDIERYIGSTNYTHRKGRPKLVAYYLMSVHAGDFEPNDEVDELHWLSVSDARERLTWDRDRDLLDLAATQPEFRESAA